MRLPNSYGTIDKLPGKRRRPWRVRLGAEYSSDGVHLTETRRVLGYYRTKREAVDALNDYHLDPFDIADTSTFAEIYDRWIREKQIKGCSTSMLNSCRAAFNKCIAIHEMQIHEIKYAHLQAVIDSYPDASASTLQNVLMVMRGIYNYCMRCDIIRRDPTQYLHINACAAPTEKHKPFTAAEIGALWDMPPSRERDITLILLYSGWRVRELLQMPADKIDMQTLTMQGGMKTKAGKDRLVPIHSRIVPLVEKYVSDPMPFGIGYTSIYEWMLKNTGHRCHDTRHTFVSELQSRGADHICIERLVGHASKSITDKVYTHKDVAELRRTVELIAYKDISMTAANA
jgi:site-specific recombinase XerD